MSTPIFLKKERKKLLASLKVGYRISLKAKSSDIDKLTVGQLREIEKKLDVKLRGTLIERNINDLLSKTFNDSKIPIDIEIRILNLRRGY